MSPTPDINVGLIGFGLAGSVFHAPFIAATPGLRLAAIVTRDEERRRRALAEYPKTQLLKTAEQLWSGSAPIDVIVVASPNGTHADLAQRALEAGAHVVVDKPFAATAAEARQVVDLARARKRLVIPFHNRRWDGDFLTLRGLIADGSLGDIYRFESRFERWRPNPKPRWLAADALANAEDVLYDLGPHLIDQALVLFGPVASVHAELDRHHAGMAGTDDAFLSLVHRSGVRSRLWVSTAAAQSGPRFAVYGSRAAYTKHGLDPQEDALRAGARPGRPRFGEETSDRWGLLGTENDARRIPTLPGSYGAFYAEVVRAIRGEAPPPVDPEDAIAGLEIIEAARRKVNDRGE